LLEHLQMNCWNSPALVPLRERLRAWVVASEGTRDVDPVYHLTQWSLWPEEWHLFQYALDHLATLLWPGEAMADDVRRWQAMAARTLYATADDTPLPAMDKVPAWQSRINALVPELRANFRQQVVYRAWEAIDDFPTPPAAPATWQRFCAEQWAAALAAVLCGAHE
jgi:hypothetical protein